MTRLEAIRALRRSAGTFLTKNCFGYEVVYGRRHSYDVMFGKHVTIVKCRTMRQRYVMKTNAKDVLRFIRRNYKR